MKRSPWGKVQIEHRLREGMTSVTTGGHGGIKLSKELNSKIPSMFRRKGGWYEEDEEWAIVAFFFPESFVGKEEMALAILKNHWPDEYMAWSGKSVQVEESWELRRRHFRAVNGSNFVVRTAFGDWHPKVPPGLVGVIAVKSETDEKGHFLVPVDDYGDADKPFGFVIDPEKHQAWDGPKQQETD